MVKEKLLSVFLGNGKDWDRAFRNSNLANHKDSMKKII